MVNNDPAALGDKITQYQLRVCSKRDIWRRNVRFSVIIKKYGVIALKSF